jgi:hypothetical protein
MSDPLKATYTQTQVLEIISDRLLLGDPDKARLLGRVKSWNRNRDFGVEPSGKGHEHTYSFEGLLGLVALVFFADHAGSLRHAREAASELTRRAMQVCVVGPEEREKAIKDDPGFVVDCSGISPVFQPIPHGQCGRKLAEAYALQPTLLVHPATFGLTVKGYAREALTAELSENE